MGGIFKDSAAPYILTLMVSLLGWMFNSAIKGGENLWIVEYEIQYATVEGVPTVTIYLENQSLKGLKAGNFLFLCSHKKYQDPSAPPCFANLPKVGVPWQPLRPEKVISPGSQPPIVVDIRSMKLAAIIPIGGKIGYRFGLAEANTPIEINYVVEDAASEMRMLLTSGWSLEGFIWGNYTPLLGYGFFSLLTLLIFWIAAAVISFFRAKEEAPKPAEKEEIVVRLITEGKSNDA
ncbi:hypothetical protein [Rhizobium leguminosarum]|uniref:hypothetical protein n=1 Tax=Rhizobium leguminosarum TaxID=384 RepID=UPI001C98D4A7|nr:hypothetical protein [Rhizobium leguminosarum]MBY5523570.1 hypothetical protein [Rhizobium leguminosarum]